MAYISETQKIRPRIEKYLTRSVIDIGPNIDKVCPSAWGVDINKTPVVDQVVPGIVALSSIVTKTFDVVYSSHCLEHIEDDIGTMRDWIKLLNPGGLMILYLPDTRYYTQYNPDHVHNYTYDSFTYKFAQITEMTIVESFMDIGEDKYSFCVVSQKK